MPLPALFTTPLCDSHEADWRLGGLARAGGSRFWTTARTIVNGANMYTGYRKMNLVRVDQSWRCGREVGEMRAVRLDRAKLKRICGGTNAVRLYFLNCY